MDETDNKTPVPQPAPSAAPETPNSPDISTYNLEGWGEPIAPVSTTEDVMKAVPAKATIGLSSIFGIPGAIGSAAQGLIYKGAGALMGPEFEADLRRNMLTGLSDEEREAVESGRAVRTKEGLFPTLIGQEEKTKNALEYTNYEPQTAPGRYAGTAAEFVGGSAPALLFAPETLAAKSLFAAREVGSAALAGVGSEAGADWAKSLNAPEYEGYFRLVGAIVTPVAAKSVSKNTLEVFQGLGRSVAPGAEYVDDTVANLILKDLQNGSSPMTLEQVQAELARGNSPSLFDMAGKNTRAYLQKVYKLTPDVEKGIDELNASMAARADEAASSAMSYIDNAYGNIGKLDVEKLKLQAAQQETNAAYTLSRTSPNAQNMWTPELSTLAYENPFIQEAMGQVNKLLEARRTGKMQADMYNVDLSYWDMVKKRLDDTINKFDPKNKVNASSADTIQYNAAVDAKKELLKLLDEAVPEYAEARGAAIDKLNVADAPEAGAKLFSLRKTPDFQESIDVFNNLKPDQQELFRRGFIRSVYDQIGNARTLNGLVDKLTSANGKKYYQQVLGTDAYNDLVGVTAAAQAKANLKAIQESTLWQRVGEGALQAKDVIQTGISVGSVVAGGAKSAGAGAVAAGIAGILESVKNRIVFNYAERKVAPEIVKLMQSTDPEDVKRLGTLIASNRDAANAFQKFNTGLYNFGLSLGLSGKEQQQSDEATALKGWGPAIPPEPLAIPVEQNRGGRVQRKSGGRVGSNAISSEVAQTRALLSNKTATMLSMPDDAIVTALHMAKHN